MIFQAAKATPPPSKRRKTRATAISAPLPPSAGSVARRACFTREGAALGWLDPLPAGFAADRAAEGAGLGAGLGSAANVRMQIKHSTAAPAAISWPNVTVEPQCGQINWVLCMATLRRKFHSLTPQEIGRA